LFGAPGSGKGTQGKTLGTIPRFFIVRAETFFDPSTPAPKSAKAFSNYRAKARLSRRHHGRAWKEAIDAAVTAHRVSNPTSTFSCSTYPAKRQSGKIMRELIDVGKSFFTWLPESRDVFAV